MTAVAAFRLTSPNTQAAAPFAIGHAFKKADVPAGQYLVADTANFAVVPLCTWNDGSLKHAKVIGRASLTANVPLQVNLSLRTVAPAPGTLLTSADIIAAAPTASFQAGAFGTATLSSVLASPVRTLISTKEMVECQYFAICGSDPSLHAHFNVQLFADGRMRVDVVMENSYFVGAPETVRKDYVPTVTIGGTMVYNNGGATFKHSPQTRHNIIGWIGTNPAITPQHDTGYLIRTGLVPNYWKNGASAGAINAWLTKNTYTPGARLGFSADMGATGYQEDIGLLPLWDALFCSSGAQKTMYDAVLAHGRAINSYRIVWQDPTTHDPIRVSDYPTYTVLGAGGGGSNDSVSVAQDGSNLVWEAAHHTSAGYLAYLLTADHYFLETCAYNAITMFMCETSASGSGVNRSFRLQNRGRGWGYRSVSQAAALVPTALASSFGHLKLWMAGIASAAVTRYVTTPPTHDYGYEDLYNNRLNGTGSIAPNGNIVAQTAPWEHHFTTQAIGMAAKLEPCDATGMVKVNQFSNYLMGAPVFICGGAGATEFNRGYLTTYVINLRIASPTTDTYEAVPAANILAATPAVIFGDTMSQYTGNNNNSTINTLLPDPQGVGGPVSDPTSYMANFLPSIAYAVDLAKTGAQAAFDGLLAATNFSAVSGANYADVPIFGIVPVAYSQQALLFTPIDSGSIVITPGPSCVWDSNPLIAGACIWDTYRGLGIPAVDIPTGFALPPLLLNDIDPADPAGTEYRNEILTGPTPSGWTTFTRFNNSAFIFDGPNNTYTGTKRVWKNGAYDDGVYSFTIGDTISGVTVTPGSATGSTTFSAVVAGTGSPSQSVTWTATAGTINSAGVFVAPAVTGSVQTITIRATSNQDSSKSGTATVTIAAASITSVVVTPVNPVIAGGALQTFSAAVTAVNSPPLSVTWSASAGSISGSGDFVAPATTGSIQSVTVTATSTFDPTKSGSTTVTVPASTGTVPTVTSVVVTPGTATVLGDGTQQFAAAVAGTNTPSQSVVWNTTAGFVSQAGLFTAPVPIDAIQTIIVSAVSLQDPSKSGTAIVTVPAAEGGTVPDTLTHKYDGTVRNNYGVAIEGAAITVIDITTGLEATLYKDFDNNPKFNPVLSDDEGYFFFFVTAGRYECIITGPGIDPYILSDIAFASGSGSGIPKLPPYAVAALPLAAANKYGMIYVTDSATSNRLALSDGTNWRWISGVIVS